MKLEQILKRIPSQSGVYKMLNKNNEIIYIGKAKNLKKRVKQYFKEGYSHSSRTKHLVKRITDIDCIAVDSELEAIILETTLIKKHKPKYNVVMKDDKNYVYIKITKEDFPKIQIVREIKNDNATYIGPKTASHKVKETFKTIKSIFPFRHCNLNIKLNSDETDVIVSNRTIKFPCLDYHIQKCIGPCINKCSKEEYNEIIKDAVHFLKGKETKIVKKLEENMIQAAKNREFEKAARLRDKLKKITAVLEKQKVSDPNQTDKDVINYIISNENAYFNIFQIRDGKLIGQENFILSAIKKEDRKEDIETLEAFLKQYYKLATNIPKEILIPHEIKTKELTNMILLLTDKKVNFIIPQIGVKNKLLNMSLNNAKIYADRNKPSFEEENKVTKKAAKDLQKILSLPKPLKRIECYDISHFGGTNTVASMIVFKNGAPDKSLYRKFKLKTTEGEINDFKSMEEVLTRRLLRIADSEISKNYKFRKVQKKDIEFVEDITKEIVDGNKKVFYVLEKIKSEHEKEILNQVKNDTIKVKNNTKPNNKITKESSKKIVGIIALQTFSKTVSQLTNLWIDEKERGNKLGYQLIKKTIAKSSTNRIYGFISPTLKEYYQVTGFEISKKIPTLLNEEQKLATKKLKEEPITIVYDRTKHQKDKSFSQVPDLIIIDGGKGQLSSVEKIFNKFNLNIPRISIAKREEEIFLPNNSTPIVLEKNHSALKLIQRARDESHRFAIIFNKQLRNKPYKRTSTA